MGIWGGSLRPAERDCAKAFGRVEEILICFFEKQERITRLSE